MNIHVETSCVCNGHFCLMFYQQINAWYVQLLRSLQKLSSKYISLGSEASTHPEMLNTLLKVNNLISHNCNPLLWDDFHNLHIPCRSPTSSCIWWSTTITWFKIQCDVYVSFIQSIACAINCWRKPQGQFSRVVVVRRSSPYIRMARRWLKQLTVCCKNIRNVA